MFDLIQSIRQRDPARPTFFEVLLAYPGFHAVGFYKVSNFLWRYKMRALARLCSHIGRFLTGIEIHPAAQIGKRLFIDHGMGVVIGATVKIGSDVTIYHGVTLGGTGQGGIEKRHPTVGDKVMIGSGAQILGAITLGSGCRVGSNAVITKSVPACCTAVGNPGRIVKGMDKSPIYGLPYSAHPDPVGQVLDELAKDIHHIKKELNKTGVNDNACVQQKRKHIGIWMGDAI